jgi:signal transduction histidine kinase
MDRLVEAQEDERAIIAAGVHDDHVQILAALEMRLSLLRNKAEQSAPSLLEATDVSLATVREATVRLRELLFDLESPAPGTNLSLAIESAASHVFEHSNVQFSVTGDDTDGLPESTRITAYRIAKEALVNVRKHAHAHRALVHLEHQHDGVLLTIDDDGIGVDSGDIVRQPGHLGLSSMRDRATVAGGSLDLQRLPSHGTRVTVWLPEHPREPRDES